LGAESDYYSTLEPPYGARNGPLETVEELLLVQGMTPELLFGEANVASYLTIYSAEGIAGVDGKPKINVNQNELRQLHTSLRSALDEEQANYIIAYRQGQPAPEANQSPSGQAVGPGQSASTLQIDFNKPAQRNINSLLELIGANVQITAEQGGEPITVASPFADDQSAMRDYLPKLLNHLTTSEAKSLPGRLNINQAPRALLQGIPGMTPATVDRIVGSRDLEFRTERPHRVHGEWLLIEGLVDLATMKKLVPFVTGGGDVYRVESVGFFEAEGPQTRIAAVLDATASPPAIVLWRELREQGARSLELLTGNQPADGMIQ
jgi:DNA uptake protein ComE-like DNA-binding protein